MEKKIKLHLFALVAVSLLGMLVLSFSCAPTTAPAPATSVQVQASASNTKIRRIAVMDFEYKAQSYYPRSDLVALAQISERSIENGGEIITDAFMQAMMQTAKYQIIERSNLAKVVNELKLSASGLTSAELNQLGQLLQIDGLVFGKVNYFSEQNTAGVVKKFKVSISVRLVDVKTGNVVWTASDEMAAGGGSPVKAAQAICSRVAGKIAANP